MNAWFAALALLATTEASVPPASSALRLAVRVALGAFIAVLIAYILIEQIGSWRRRRLDRDHR